MKSLTVCCGVMILVAAAAADSFAQAAAPGSATRGSGGRVAGGATATGFALHETAPSGAEPVFDFAMKSFGFVPNLTKVMSSSPALANSYMQTQINLKQQGQLTQAEINVVQMAIAVENKCEYCVAGHTMAGQAFFKTPEQDMQSVRMRKSLGDPKLNALRNFAILVYMKKGEVSPGEFQQFLSAGYTRGQALDVVACVAAKVMSNYTNSLAKTPLDPQIQPLAEGLPFAAK